MTDLRIVSGERISDGALRAWLRQAHTGDVLVYHRGFLARDAILEGGELSERQRAELGRLARRARYAAEAGHIHLLQRRLGKEEFEYLAVMRPRRARPAAALRLAEAA